MAPRIRSWSTSPVNNSQTPPFGAPEGATPVNQLTDILRQVMAEIRAWWEVPGWIDYGHTPTFVSTTQFSVGGDVSATYHVDRRIRATNSTGTTFFGTISACVFSTNTTVTVTWDGTAMDSALTEVAVGAATVTTPWISFRALAGTILRSQMPAETIFQTGMSMPYFGTTAPAGWIMWFGTIGSATSGASNRANADTQALYERTWNIFANTEAPVTGGRGASAAADFAANKAIALPDAQGCVIAMMDNLSGTASGRITSAVSGLDGTVRGRRGGDQRMHKHTHVQEPHFHAINNLALQLPRTGGGATRVYDEAAQVKNTEAATAINQDAGEGTSQNVQPTIMMPYIVKL